MQAPGRVELLGNHTDYNEGLVLAVAVDRFLQMAISPRDDGRIELVSSAFPQQREKFWISDLAPNPAAPWTGYVKGVLAGLRRQGAHFGGFNAAIHTTLPPGAGLASSAALCVATALAIRELHPYRLTETGTSRPPRRDSRDRLPELSAKEKLYLARICQQAERDFAGVHCGLLDPLSILHGREFHALEMDFKHHTVEPMPLVGEIALVLCHTGVPHALADGEYNLRRELCAGAARKLGLKSLRSVDSSLLAENRKSLTAREHDCAFHVMSENHRVVFAGRALREGDLMQFGQYLFQSHESSRDLFQNSTPELDLLVELARAHPACLGARLTGGGFGGATLNLVAWARADDFAKTMKAQYEARSGRPLLWFRCRVVDGAGRA